MKKARLTHIVTFRLDSQQWEQLQAVSQASQQKPNDWVRDLTTQTLAPGIGLKPSERFLFEHFARTVSRHPGFSTPGGRQTDWRRMDEIPTLCRPTNL